MHISLFDKAYAAGFFDGEGSIYISLHPRGMRYGLRRKGFDHGAWIAIGNDDRDSIEWLRQTWGLGSISHRERKNGKIGHAWKAHGNEACQFLNDILPFLKIKKERAMLFIEFQARKMYVGHRRSGLPIGEFEERERIRKELSDLNDAVGKVVN